MHADEWEAEILQHWWETGGSKELQLKLDQCMVSKKAKNIYGWLELIIEYDMELSCVNDPKLLKHVKLESISTDTTAKYLHLMVESVQEMDKKP